jgi:hypothetical protein
VFGNGFKYKPKVIFDGRFVHFDFFSSQRLDIYLTADPATASHRIEVINPDGESVTLNTSSQSRGGSGGYQVGVTV